MLGAESGFGQGMLGDLYCTNCLGENGADTKFWRTIRDMVSIISFAPLFFKSKKMFPFAALHTNVDLCGV
jgi:hypothetical protein